MHQDMFSPRTGLTYTPEFNIVMFALLLNLPWEFLQVPFFAGMPSADHWDGVKTCARATLGDAVIMLMAYWGVALRAGRYWLAKHRLVHLAVFVGIGITITIAIEMLALAGVWMDGWSYAETMVTLPLLGVGVTPILQWLILPPIALWFSRRQTGA